jgi:uncharacterized protein (TIGR02246 family)
MYKIIFNSIFLLLILCTSQVVAQSTPPNPTDDEKEIRGVIDNYYNAWNQHDAKKMAGYYAIDGDLRTPWNEIGQGRQEVEKVYASEMNKQMKDAQIEKSVKSIRMVKPTIAFVDVESTITHNQSVQKHNMPFHHHVVYVLVKRDDQWQILIGRPF